MLIVRKLLGLSLIAMMGLALLMSGNSHISYASSTIVDNTDAEFTVVSGTWNTSTTLSGYYGTNYRSSPSGAGASKVRWTPNISDSGYYKVYVMYTSDTNRASNAPYTLYHTGGSTTVQIDQRFGGGQWVLLGTFAFDSGTSGYIELSNNANGYVIADAVSIVPATLLIDDFETDNANNWTVVSGSWGVVTDGSSKVYRTTTASGAALSIAGEAAWTNYTLEADMKLSTIGSLPASGIVVRYIDSNNYYLLRIQHDQQKVRLHRISNGAWTTLSETAFASGTGQWYTIKAVVDGSSIQGYVDGSLKVSATDATHQSGKIGFRTYDAYTSFDDVVVEGEGNAFFTDVGVVSSGNHALPSIIAVDENTVTIGAQVRYVTTVSGGHFEKGAADIVTFRSTDKGDTWGPMRYIYQTSGVNGDSGYSSVFVNDEDDLLNVYTVGPQNWSSDELVVYQKSSSDGGDTWSSAITPTIINDHANAKPTNGGQGYQYPDGRLVIPARKSLLYSDNGGSTWTATPEFGGHVETKVQPHYIDGLMTFDALVPWRTQNVSSGTIERVRIADSYSHEDTETHSYGANNNFGFVRYDENTLLMTVTKNSNSSSRLYVRMSTDEGLTWTNEKDITGSATSARYSDIAVMPDGTIVVVFMLNNTSASNGSPLRVVKFNMDWMLQ